MSKSNFLAGLIIGAFAFIGGPIFNAQDQGSKDDPKDAKQDAPPKLMRGAKPTPPAKIIASIKSGKAGIHRANSAPAQIVVVPKKLSMWGNSQFGDCVTAESCFAIADYSSFIGMDEIFVTEATCIAWARTHGWLNGADLLSVIQDMEADGIKDEKGILRKAGKPSSVDYRNEAILQSAIAVGPVSIAIDADALPSGAGNKSGWYARGSRSFPNTDHCVSVHGYGPASAVFTALGVPLPSFSANEIVYMVYTWNTIGVVDHKWIMNTVVEGWVRTPTVTDLQPPPPPVKTITVTVANVAGAVGASVKLSPSASGGTSPYMFLFDYGDGVQDASGSHTYKSAGSYKVTVTAVDSVGNTGTAYCTASIGVTPPPPTPGGSLTIPDLTAAQRASILHQLGVTDNLDEIQRHLDAIRLNIPKR